MDPNYRDGLLELADLYEKDKQPAEAIAIYREFPENAAAQGRMGELLLETNEYAGAIPHLEEAYAKDSTQENRVALAAFHLNRPPRDRQCRSGTWDGSRHTPCAVRPLAEREAFRQ